MADHVVDDDDFFGGGIFFIYRGGRAPQHVTHVLIDKSIDEIEANAFDGCEHLVQVDTHYDIIRVGRHAFSGCRSLRRINLNRIRIIAENAFDRCISLRRINLKSAVIIEDYAFDQCENLESVEFGDRLEEIGHSAFNECSSLKHLKIPSIIWLGQSFMECTSLTDVELSERLETIEALAFLNCKRLQRIAIPLKRDLIAYDIMNHAYNQFDDCEQLVTFDLVGGIHETVASLHMESWRTEMNESIHRINQQLPTTPIDDKTDEIRQWMHSVVDKLDYYKAEHCRFVKEGVTLLELAVWKANLDEKEKFHQRSWLESLVTHIWGEGRKKKAKIDIEAIEAARKEKLNTCGAEIVIKNVLPFLKLA